MNLIIYWKTDRRYILKLKEKFGAKNVVYLDNREDFIYKEKNSCMKYIHTMTTIDELYNENDIDNLLDKKIIDKMQPYAMTGMGIINRWRRTVSNGESYFSLKETYYKYLQFWYDLIKKKNISLYIMSFAEPHIPMTFFPYAICKALEIPTIIMSNLPIIDGERLNFYFETSVDNLGKAFVKRYDSLRRLYEENTVDIELESHLNKYFEMYNHDNKEIKNVIIYNEKSGLGNIANKYWSRARIYLSKKKYKALIRKAKYYLFADVKSKPMLRYISKYEEQPHAEKYFVFFLHLQPESTTLPKAGCYEDQLLAIRMLSKYLPRGIKLYVKEHPAYWDLKNRHENIYESRNKFFYNEIVSLSNVRLIDHKYDSLTLMDNSLAVITMVGTAGFEAIFKGIPVITFAEAAYSQFKYTHNIRTNEDCKQAIENIIGKSGPVGNLRDVKIYLKALEPSVVPYGSDEPSYIENGTPIPDEGDFQRFVKSVYKYYEDNYK